jgi:hypothetical protein
MTWIIPNVLKRFRYYILLNPELKYQLLFIVFEVLTAVIMKSSIFWTITLCSLVKVNQHFRGTCYLHLQGWRVSQALPAACLMLVSCATYPSTQMQHVLLKRQLTTWHYIAEDRTLLKYIHPELRRKIINKNYVTLSMTDLRNQNMPWNASQTDIHKI